MGTLANMISVLRMTTPEPLNENDVILADDVLANLSIFQVDSLLEAIEKDMNKHVNFTAGFNSKVLKEGSMWRNGTIKAKVIVEFYPDEPKSEHGIFNQ